MLKELLGIIELRGIQASGKTTLARSLVSQSSKLVRVNRDDLRSMMFGTSYRLRDEPVVTACERACAEVSVKRGYGVVVDDTNLTGGSLWEDVADSLGVSHSSKYLKIPVEEAIRRDALRPDPVGVVAIRAAVKRSRL